MMFSAISIAPFNNLKLTAFLANESLFWAYLASLEDGNVLLIYKIEMYCESSPKNLMRYSVAGVECF